MARIWGLSGFPRYSGPYRRSSTIACDEGCSFRQEFGGTQEGPLSTHSGHSAPVPSSDRGWPKADSLLLGSTGLEPAIGAPHDETWRATCLRLPLAPVIWLLKVGAVLMTSEIVSLAAYRAAKGHHAPTSAPFSKEAQREDRRKHPRDEDYLNDTRSEPRHPMQGRCALSLTLAGETARLVNVSRSGLMAAANLRNNPGSRILVAVAGCKELSGRLIWKRNGLVGIEVPIGTMNLRLI
jgi:hypothetical protein